VEADGVGSVADALQESVPSGAEVVTAATTKKSMPAPPPVATLPAGHVAVMLLKSVESGLVEAKTTSRADRPGGP
jgi:hypothetical protein